jgi:AraC-like DNA-binding protein
MNEKPHADGTSFAINLTAVERVLGRTPAVAIGQFRCPVTHAQFAGGGPQLCAYLVFPRRPVRIHVEGGQPEVAAPGLLRFYDLGDRYRRFAVGAQPDESDWIAIAPSVLEALAAAAPGAFSPSSQRFAARSAAASARLCLAQRRVFAWAAQAGDADVLGLEEAVLGLVCRSLEEAAAAWRGAARRTRAARAPSERRRRHIAEQAMEILALDPALELSVAQVAWQVHCSVAHLSRVFRHYTGVTLHAYRQKIRLHHALQLIEDGAASLVDVAASTGFSSHSHMTSAFGRHFGALPSAPFGTSRVVR